MKALFETRSSRSGPSYVDEYRGFSLAGFQELRHEAAEAAKADPLQFRDTLVATADVAPEEANAHVRRLLQESFDHSGVVLVMPEDSVV